MTDDEIYTEQDFYDDDLPWRKRLLYFRTGSREICSPPSSDTDADFVVLDLMRKETFEGFRCTTDDNRDSYGATLSDFETYPRGEVNLIVVHNPDQFFAWKVATAAAKQMNLTRKADRIHLFQGVLYGNWGGDMTGDWTDESHKHGADIIQFWCTKRGGVTVRVYCLRKNKYWLMKCPELGMGVTDTRLPKDVDAKTAQRAALNMAAGRAEEISKALRK